MSHIFQPLLQPTAGSLPTNDGVGPIVDPIAFQHMKLDINGAIHTAAGGITSHYGAGLPFDQFGRLVVGGPPAVRVTQGVPFNAQNEVVLADIFNHYNQRMSHEENSSIVAVDPPIIPPLEDCVWDAPEALWDQCLWADSPIECVWDDPEATWGGCLWGAGPFGYIINPPTSLVGVGSLPGGTGRVDLTWSAAVGNTNPDATYGLFKDDIFLAEVTAPTTVYIDIDGLLPDVAYTYEILVVDTTGRISQRSAPVPVGIPNLIIWQPPENLQAATIDEETLRLSWSDPLPPNGTFPIASYSVFRDGIFFGSTFSQIFDAVMLPIGETFGWSVEAVDDQGNNGLRTAVLVDTWRGVRTTPLEAHADWTLIGAGPTVSFIDDAGFGGVIIGTDSGPTAPPFMVSSVQTPSPVRDVTILTQGLIRSVGADNTSWMLAGRIVDEDNLIGVRSINGNLEAVEVISGVENVIITVANPTGVNPYTLELSLDGVIVGLRVFTVQTLGSTVFTTAGSAGVGFNTAPITEDDLIKNFTVTEISAPVVFFDSFTGTPGNGLDIHTPIIDDSGQGWNSGAWEIAPSGTEAINTAAIDTSSLMEVAGLATGTLELQVAFLSAPATETYMQVIMRNQNPASSDDEVRFRIIRQTNDELHIEVYNVVGGVATLIDTFITELAYTTAPVAFRLTEIPLGIRFTTLNTSQSFFTLNPTMPGNPATVNLGVNTGDATPKELHEYFVRELELP